MKITSAKTKAKCAAIFAAASLLAANRSFADASLGIISPKVSTNGSLTVTDPANSFWIIQSSTDLVNWQNYATWKVYNGNFHSSIPYTNFTGGKFFRAVFDASRQTNLDTTSTALSLPSAAYNYANPAIPAKYKVPPISNSDNTPSTNSVTDAGATLGRVLFYDKRLSTNQTVSCSSCHQQQNGFSDPRKVSVGFDGSIGTRNAMGLTDARYYARGKFFWDERSSTLEDQVLKPIQNPIEMGMTLSALVPRLAAEPFYTNLFAQAFGSMEVNTNRITLALAQFVRSLVSTNSKYDQGVNVGFTNFTAQENTGRQIFFGQTGNATCAACHGTDTFSAPNIFNNGLEFPYVDTGVGGITGLAGDMGLFKVPSLRNIALTAPYMHDGRFTNLEEVVEFYNSGVVFNANLSAPLRTPRVNGVPPSALRLNLTADQKAALVAFLKTLSDPTLNSDAKFSDPFNYGN